MLEVAVLVGLQASGKTTFARRFAATHVVVSKDDWPRARHRQRRQMRLVGEALAAGRSVLVDNTNPSPQEWAPLVEAAHAAGARAVAYWFVPDAARSAALNARRPGAERVPDVGLRRTAALLRRPTAGDGFDAVVAVAWDGSGGFSLAPVPDEAPDGDPVARRFPEPVDGAPEVPLPAGDVTEGVVRVGATVRRPHQPQSLAVAGYLDHLQRAGFRGSPRYLGRDGRGRDVLTHLPGQVAGSPPEAWAAAEPLLVSVARLVRELHDASAGYLAATGFAAPEGSCWQRDLVRVELPVAEPAPEIVTHLDVTPQNVVVRDGLAVGLVDFDMAGPATRLADVVNTATWWAPLRDPADAWPGWRDVDPRRRLRLFADAYGLTDDERGRFADLAVARAVASRVRMRAAAEQLGGGWARMWREGVGDAIARREAWLRENAAALTHALLLEGGPRRG